jgi:hypothetical protein
MPGSTSGPAGPDGWGGAGLSPPPAGIGELEPLLTQLASKDTVLLHQIRERLALLTIQPAGQNRKHHVESRHVDHGGSLEHGVTVGCSGGVGGVMGHYGPPRSASRSCTEWLGLTLIHLRITVCLFPAASLTDLDQESES